MHTIRLIGHALAGAGVDGLIGWSVFQSSVFLAKFGATWHCLPASALRRSQSGMVRYDLILLCAGAADGHDLVRLRLADAVGAGQILGSW
jgi:hypothetical protein